MDSKRQMDVQAKGTLYDERELCIFENLRELILLKHRNLGQKGNANLKTVQDIRNHLFQNLILWMKIKYNLLKAIESISNSLCEKKSKIHLNMMHLSIQSFTKYLRTDC